MAIYLIRHTTPNIEKGVCYGQTDLMLADSFPAELEEIRSLMANVAFEAVYSSPLHRCLHLATLLFSVQEVNKDPKLMEINFGDWEMQAWTAIPKHEMNAWGEDFVNRAAPHGESYIQLYERAISFFTTLQVHPDKNYAIVTHSGVLRSILAYLLEMPLRKSFDMELSYGAVIRITHVHGEHHRIKFLKI